ncbi:proliferating cell nuclear antigen [Martensiomyces pterosporus]|nr:proliferating cell nuclear antigen [Martensiomyces pterosporus]
MIEAVLAQASVLKKIIEAIKELVTEANFDFNESGISLQAMDSSHIALSVLLLREDGFKSYRCDRSLSLGINLSSFSKILKCAANDDEVQIRAGDDADILGFSFESAGKERVSEFSLKLMDIDIDAVDIPEMEYQAVISMSSQEFARIIRDLSSVGEAVTIDATKEGVKFSSAGDAGSGSILLKHQKSVDSESSLATSIQINEPVSHSLALKFLANFAKAAPLAERVSIHLTEEAPVMFEFKISDIGHIRFYLAPQIDDEE